MKLPYTKSVLAASLCILIISCGSPAPNSESQTQAMDTAKTAPQIKTAEVLYTFNGKQSIGFIAFDENKKGKLPVIVVVPEWWGLNDYTKSRARQLAGLGYFAICADPFGDGKTADNPKDATELTKLLYTHPELSLPLIETTIAKAATFPKADTSRVAAIGYCFGGSVVLNAAKLGAPLKGAVSFHGGLPSIQPKKGVIKADILVCQGGADPLVPETDQAAFKKSMDSVGAHYTFISYPGAMHSFTNPASTANGEKFKMPIAYNAAADTASWKDMQALLVTALK